MSVLQGQSQRYTCQVAPTRIPMDGIETQYRQSSCDRFQRPNQVAPSWSIQKKSARAPPPAFLFLPFKFSKNQSRSDPQAVKQPANRRQQPHQVSLLGLIFDQDFVCPVGRGARCVSTKRVKQQTDSPVNSVLRIICDIRKYGTKKITTVCSINYFFTIKADVKQLRGCRRLTIPIAPSSDPKRKIALSNYSTRSTGRAAQSSKSFLGWRKYLGAAS